MTDNQTLPPPQGPEYARCFGCGHIEPEHRPGTGPCLVCACAAYRAVPVVPVSSPPPDQTADELAKHVTRAIFALKSPPPPGSEHYRSGWDDGLEAAMDAARDEVLRRLAAEAQQPETETRPVARIVNPQTGAGFGTGGNWPRKRQDATVDPAMCPRCKGDNSEAFQLCAACATPEPPPVHKGGNADDCPACQTDGLDTIGPPYECPGGETAGEGGRPD